MSDIFSVSDYWRANKALEDMDEHEPPVDDYAVTLYEHGPYKSHCGLWQVHAWPCPTASAILSDLREAVGREAWLTLDYFMQGDQ